MPQDDTLIAELTAPTYSFTSTGKMVVKIKGRHEEAWRALTRFSRCLLVTSPSTRKNVRRSDTVSRVRNYSASWLPTTYLDRRLGVSGRTSSAPPSLTPRGSLRSRFSVQRSTPRASAASHDTVSARSSGLMKKLYLLRETAVDAEVLTKVRLVWRHVPDPLSPWTDGRINANQQSVAMPLTLCSWSAAI